MRDMPAIGAAADPDRGTRALSGLRTAFSRIMAVILFIFAIAVWARIAGLPVVRPVLTAIYDRVFAPLIYRLHLRRRARAAKGRR